MRRYWGHGLSGNAHLSPKVCRQGTDQVAMMPIRAFLLSPLVDRATGSIDSNETGRSTIHLGGQQSTTARNTLWRTKRKTATATQLHQSMPPLQLSIKRFEMAIGPELGDISGWDSICGAWDLQFLGRSGAIKDTTSTMRYVALPTPIN